MAHNKVLSPPPPPPHIRGGGHDVVEDGVVLSAAKHLAREKHNQSGDGLLVDVVSKGSVAISKIYTHTHIHTYTHTHTHTYTML